MTALATTIFTAIIIMGAATFLIFWTLDNVKSGAIKTTAIIIYGFCFIITLATVVVEAIKASF